MSTPKGIRLWLRPARGSRALVWIIRDGDGQKSTECGPREFERASQARAAYISASHKPQSLGARDVLRDRGRMLGDLGHTIQEEDSLVRGEMMDRVIMLLDAVDVAPSLTDKSGLLSHGGGWWSQRSTGCIQLR